MLAFLTVGAIMVAVAGRVAWVSRYREVQQPDLQSSTPGKLPEYSILDRMGRTIAHSVPRFDLEMSPRSMWQVHTPLRIARKLDKALGGTPGVEALLNAFFPSAERGVIDAKRFLLNAREANRVACWLAGEAGEDRAPPIQGMWLKEVQPGRQWSIQWRPLVLLSEEHRTLQKQTSAWRWARQLASSLARCRLAPGEEFPRSDDEAKQLREEIWRLLVPRAATTALKGIPSDRVMAVRLALKQESVAGMHMRVSSFERDREYPAEKQELFGDWGFVTLEDKEPRPRGGLELLCNRMLASEAWSSKLSLKASKYDYRWDRTILGQRSNAYVDYEEASEAPYLESTLDLHLQDFLSEQLSQVMDEHKPAIAMGIVLDVQSGDVLAVSSQEAYEVQPFAPIHYLYTIGSTFKILTMACALEEDQVGPYERIDVGAGAYQVRYTRGPKAGRLSHRIIREAEGAKQGTIEARVAFAFSVNAGLAQVGLRMEDSVFHGYLMKLGYGQKPGSGLGSEQAGYLAGLPWKYAYTHASISFGHEITSTLWQHAAAINTVVRGGVPVKLRMLKALGQGLERYSIASEESERIFSRKTSAEVLDMMRFGADEGTGRYARAELQRLALAAIPLGQRQGLQGEELLDLGTKTGTAQKVKTELCVHIEKRERMRLKAAGKKMSMAHYNSLKTWPEIHPECYTSSIVIYAKLAQPERELLIYIVVDEPTGKERFGSKVAGPAAVRVMAEALGLTIDGETPRAPVIEGVYSTHLAARNVSEEPWQVGEHASW